MKNYLKNIDETAFHAWLRANGWTEDTSPSTETWTVPAWWHEARMVTKREDWLVDDYEDHLFEQQHGSISMQKSKRSAFELDPFSSTNPNNAPHLDT